jgi:hypothetical protein
MRIVMGMCTQHLEHKCEPARDRRAASMKGSGFPTTGSGNSMPEAVASLLMFTALHYRLAPIMPHPDCNRKETRAASNHFMI